MKNEKKSLTFTQKALACLYAGALIGTINSATLIMEAKDSVANDNSAKSNMDAYISDVASGNIINEADESYLDHYKRGVEQSLNKMYMEKSSSVVRNHILDNTGKHDVINYIESQPEESHIYSDYAKLNEDVNDQEENMLVDMLQALAGVIATGTSYCAIANISKKSKNDKTAQDSVVEEIVAENVVEDDLCK